MQKNIYVDSEYEDYKRVVSSGVEIAKTDYDYIMQGDCMALLNTLPDNYIDCIVTSPPYNKKFFQNGKQTNQIWSGFTIDYSSYSDNLPIEIYEEWMINFLQLCVKKLKDSGSIFFNHKPIRHDGTIYHPMSFLLKSGVNIRQEIIWDRRNSPNIRNDIFVPCTERMYWITKGKPKTKRCQVNKNYLTEVWNIRPKIDKTHPAPFPQTIVENCVLMTTNEGDIVLDPFLGCGTTAVTAINTNRHYIGFEIDPKYFEIAQDRIRIATESTLKKK